MAPYFQKLKDLGEKRLKGLFMVVKYWEDCATAAFLAAHIQQDHLFMGTTDTVIGLYAPANPRGVAALNAIKGRVDKPYIVLVCSVASAQRYVLFDKTDIIAQCMQAFWPGPLTIIGRVTSLVSAELGLEYRTIALRWPAHPGLNALLGLVPALLSTSANVAGSPVAATPADIDPLLCAKVPVLVLDEGQPHAQGGGIASTIIDCSGDAVVLIRAGELVSQGALCDFIGKKIVYE